MAPPEKRKPASGKTGSLKIEAYGAAIDRSEDSPTVRDLQAFRLRSRFGLSWPTARVVAELAFSQGRAA